MAQLKCMKAWQGAEDDHHCKDKYIGFCFLERL